MGDKNPTKRKKTIREKADSLPPATSLDFPQIPGGSGYTSSKKKKDNVYTYEGVFGSHYIIQVPLNWNGTLFLNLRGGKIPGLPNTDSRFKPPVEQWFLENGYAVGGYSYSRTWASVPLAIEEFPRMLEVFEHVHEKPHITIAAGNSMGGYMCSLIAERYPELVDGVVKQCSASFGELVMQNGKLDGAFVLKTLLSPDIKIVNFDSLEDAQATKKATQDALEKAQATAQGRAHIALIGALSGGTEWADPDVPRPTDYKSLEFSYYKHLPRGVFMWEMTYMLEFMFGGNASWNVGIDYDKQLDISNKRSMITALYKEAGLNLADDLKKLAKAPRISPNMNALLKWMTIQVTGYIKVPVFNFSSPYDDQIPVTLSGTYSNLVAAAGKQELLRTAYADYIGHSQENALEAITNYMTLLNRVTTGKWGDTSQQGMKALAARISENSPGFFIDNNGKKLDARYIDFNAGQYIRPPVWPELCF